MLKPARGGGCPASPQRKDSVQAVPFQISANVNARSTGGRGPSVEGDRDRLRIEPGVRHALAGRDLPGVQSSKKQDAIEQPDTWQGLDMDLVRDRRPGPGDHRDLIRSSAFLPPSLLAWRLVVPWQACLA